MQYRANFIVHVHVDAVTIVLFKVLGAFANRPFDTTLMDDERDITAADVRKLTATEPARAVEIFVPHQFHSAIYLLMSVCVSVRMCHGLI